MFPSEIDSHYYLLAIPPTAEDGDVREACTEIHRALQARARKNEAGANEKIVKVNEANTSLSDEAKRSEYDQKWPGKSVFAIHDIAPPLAKTRLERMRCVEEILRESGLGRDLWAHSDLERSEFPEDRSPLPGVDTP